jgi:hypothetical protein
LEGFFVIRKAANRHPTRVCGGFGTYADNRFLSEMRSVDWELFTLIRKAANRLPMRVCGGTGTYADNWFLAKCEVFIGSFFCYQQSGQSASHKDFRRFWQLCG